MPLPCSSGSFCASFKDVEHSCQQCGTTVEDGRPFCPQCRAPQIHVQIAVPDSGVTAGLNSAGDGFSPEISPSGQFDRPGTLNRKIAVRAALKAGVLGVFIGMIPFLGIVLTGALAVYFYRRESRLVLPAAFGARLGGAAGVVSFAINALLLTIRIFIFHAQQEYIDFFTRFARTIGANAADPDFQAVIHSLLTPAGLAISFIFGVIFALVLAGAGGALASLFLRPRNSQM
ncbi:MAG: zinc ribbon domain-containing protein [Terriglobales bacterium]